MHDDTKNSLTIQFNALRQRLQKEVHEAIEKFARATGEHNIRTGGHPVLSPLASTIDAVSGSEEQLEKYLKWAEAEMALSTETCALQKFQSHAGYNPDTRELYTVPSKCTTRRPFCGPPGHAGREED